MESEEKPEKENSRGRGSRKRKEPKPPLQSDGPMEEGASAAAQPAVPAAGGSGGDEGGQKISSGKAGDPKSMRVAEIMTEDPVCCLPETLLAKVARMMAENSCGAIPVIRGQEDRAPVGTDAHFDQRSRELVSAGIDGRQGACFDIPALQIVGGKGEADRHAEQ